MTDYSDPPKMACACVGGRKTSERTNAVLIACEEAGLDERIIVGTLGLKTGLLGWMDGTAARDWWNVHWFARLTP